MSLKNALSRTVLLVRDKLTQTGSHNSQVRWFPLSTAFKKKIRHFLFSASAHSRYLGFYSLSGKSFISLSLSFTMPSLIRVRALLLNFTLRKIRLNRKQNFVLWVLHPLQINKIKDPLTKVFYFICLEPDLNRH